MSSYKRVQLRRAIERIEQQVAETAQPADTFAGRGRLNAATLAHIRQFLGAIREGGAPLPREITPEIEADRATLTAGRPPGEIEQHAAQCRQLLERIARNLEVSQPLNAQRLTGEGATVRHAEPGQRPDAGHERVWPTVERVAPQVADGNVERSRRESRAPGPSDGSRVWNLVPPERRALRTLHWND